MRSNLQSTWSQSTSGTAIVVVLLMLWLGATVYLRYARYIRSKTAYVMIGLNMAVLALTFWSISR